MSIATHDPARMSDASDILEELAESLFDLPHRNPPSLLRAVAELKQQVDALPLTLCTADEALRAEVS